MGWHPESRWVDVDGLKAHYVRQGPSEDAPTLVMLHGFLVSSWAWRFNVPALARDFDVIAPCQKGHGWTARGRKGYTLADLGGFVLGLLDRLGVERFHVCGNSLGGAVALWLAHAHPDRVERVVLVNPLALGESLPAFPSVLQARPLAPLYRVFVQPSVARLGLQVLAYRGLRLDADYMAGFRAPFEEKRSVRTAIAVSRALNDAARDVERTLSLIQQPSLVVWGTADRLLGARSGPRIARRLPNARLLTFPDCGHCAHEEAPERFNSAVREFLLGPPTIGA